MKYLKIAAIISLVGIMLIGAALVFRYPALGAALVFLPMWILPATKPAT